MKEVREQSMWIFERRAIHPKKHKVKGHEKRMNVAGSGNPKEAE